MPESSEPALAAAFAVCPLQQLARDLRVQLMTGEDPSTVVAPVADVHGERFEAYGQLTHRLRAADRTGLLLRFRLICFRHAYRLRVRVLRRYRQKSPSS